jgi:RNA polymerase sigma factor (sigma-70 family)
MDVASQPDRAVPIAVALLRLASDQRLVEHARAGSEAAFEALYHRHRRAVLAYCHRTLRSADDADDAMQQTFVAAYYSLDRLEHPFAVRAWLYGIARHRCQSALRARNGDSLDSAPEPVADGVAAELVARDDLRAVLADVAGLPDDQRFAIIQAELGGLSHDQIARVLGCRHDKVKALIFQARASLTANRAARETPCEEIQRQLATLRGPALRRAALRRHLANCAACTEFREQLRGKRRSPRSLVPAFLLNRGILGPLFGGTSETALSVGAVGTGGLTATALVAVALYGGDIVRAVTPGSDHAAVAAMARSSGATTANGQHRMLASSLQVWGAHLTNAAPPPSRHQASESGPAGAPEWPDSRQSPTGVTQPASPAASDATPRTDRPDQSRTASDSDKAAAAGDDASAKHGGGAPADPQSAEQAPEGPGDHPPAAGTKPAHAAAPTGAAGPPDAHAPGGATRPATPSPEHPPRRPPAPQADAPHSEPTAPPAPSASGAAPPPQPGIVTARDQDTPPSPNANGQAADNPRGPAHAPIQTAVAATPPSEPAPAAPPGPSR